ncbi:unnamed protein product, partial [Amoebophrya sp. A25]|eukprot:GSA25T00016379001.1
MLAAFADPFVAHLGSTIDEEGDKEYFYSSDDDEDELPADTNGKDGATPRNLQFATARASRSSGKAKMD